MGSEKVEFTDPIGGARFFAPPVFGMPDVSKCFRTKKKDIIASGAPRNRSLSFFAPPPSRSINLQTMTNINEEIKFGMDSKDDEKVAVSNQQQVLSSMFTNAASATGQLSLTFVGAYDFQTRNTE